MTRKLELRDSDGEECRFTVEDARRARDALQKYIEESIRALRPEEVKHGMCVYLGRDERMVVGTGNQFYLIDSMGRLLYGINGPVTAEHIVAAGYTRSPAKG